MPVRTCLSLVVVVAVVVVMCPGTARGQTAPAGSVPAVTSELRTQFGASYNNLGLQQSLEWTRKRLLKPGSGPLTSDAHLMGGAQIAASPSYARLHFWAQYAPLSIVTLRVGVEQAQYFGTFDSLMPFDAADQPFDTDSRKDRGGARADRAQRVYVAPTLRLRAGPIVALGGVEVENWRSSSPGVYFYEPTRDTLLRSGGTTLTSSRVLLMYEHVTAGGTRVGMGALHTRQDHEDVPHFGDFSGLRIQRAGLITSIQSDNRLLGLRRPTITVAVARYLDDPSKQDGWTAFLTVATTLRRR